MLSVDGKPSEENRGDGSSAWLTLERASGGFWGATWAAASA